MAFPLAEKHRVIALELQGHGRTADIDRPITPANTEFLTSLSASNADLVGWTDEQLATITAPTLIVQGDHDFVTIEHAGLMLELIPGSRLAVLPGTTHMQATRRPELLLPMLEEFLDRLTAPTSAGRIT